MAASRTCVRVAAYLMSAYTKRPPSSCLKSFALKSRGPRGALSIRGFSAAECSSSGRHLITIAVEGNIGSGKSTFLNFLRDSLKAEVLHEPVDRWQDVKGHNALALMYSDPARWCLALQTYVQLTMLQRHLEVQASPLRFLERSIFSARYCFVENLYRRGIMPAVEYAILDEWFQWILSNLRIHVDLIVYFRTKPDTIYQRIKARRREEESGLSLEYLQNLHDLHEDWLVKGKFACPAPVIIVDANDDRDSMVEKYEGCLQELKGRRAVASSPISAPEWETLMRALTRRFA